MVSFAKNSVKPRTRGGYNKQRQAADSLNNSVAEQVQDKRSRTVSRVEDLDVNAVSQFESFGIGNANGPEVINRAGNKRSIQDDESSAEQADTNKKLKSNYESASELINKITGETKL